MLPKLITNFLPENIQKYINQFGGIKDNPAEKNYSKIKNYNFNLTEIKKILDYKDIFDKNILENINKKICKMVNIIINTDKSEYNKMLSQVMFCALLFHKPANLYEDFPDLDNDKKKYIKYKNKYINIKNKINI